MTAAQRLIGFALVLALSLGAGLGLGTIAGPIDTGSGAEHGGH